MPYPDRWDYTSSGLLNEWACARAAEDLTDIEMPEYAQIIRTMGAELYHIALHMIALGTSALDVYNDFTAIFIHTMWDHEIVQNILEDLTDWRMVSSYFRPDGVVWNLPEPREGFFEKIRDSMDGLPQTLEEYHDVITSNGILQVRTVGTGVLSPEVVKSYGATGLIARGSGINYDLHRDDPYGYYDEFEWDVIVEDGCDNFSRLLVRMRKVEESAKVIQQCTDLLEDWPEDERNIRANAPRTLRPGEDTEIYRAVEGARDGLGVHVRTDGVDKPARFKTRSPRFSNLQTFPEMSESEYIPDMIVSLDSSDIVPGEVGR